MALSKIESDSIASTIDLSGISLTLPDGSVTSSKLDTNIAITGNFTVDTDTLYVDSANNRVGIGTTSPSSELFLYKATGGTTLRLKSDGSNTYDGSTIILTSGQITEGTQFGSLWIDCVRAPGGEGNFTIQRRDRDLNYKGAIIGYTDGTNGLRFSTASATTDALSTERMRITGAGNVGIGTSSPTSELHINKNGSDVGIRINCADTTGTAKLQFGTQSDVVSTAIQFDASDNSLQFRGFDNTERMRISSLGRVGIGTTNPSQSLDVNGAIQVSGGIYLGGTTSANLLDDYEEGTWTPGIDAAGSSPNAITYTTQSAYYVKIGNLVHVWGNINVSTISGGSGQIVITGLPFTVADKISATGVDGMGYCPFWSTLNTAIYWLGCWALGGTNHLRMTKTAEASIQATDFQPGDLKSASQFRFWCTYVAS